MATTRNGLIKTSKGKSSKRNEHERLRRLKIELDRRAEMMQNDPVAFQAMRTKERELWKEKQNNRISIRKDNVKGKRPERKYHIPVPVPARVSIDTCKFCFICLNDSSSNRQSQGESDDGNDEEHKFKCLKVLTFYLLRNSPSSSSPSHFTREDMQRNIMSSLENRELSACAECLSRGKNLFKLHTEVEIIQTNIANFLKDFLDCVKTSLENKSDIESSDVTLSRFQEFLCNQKSDGRQWSSDHSWSRRISSTISRQKNVTDFMGRVKEDGFTCCTPVINSNAIPLKTDESKKSCFICLSRTSPDRYDETPLINGYNSVKILTAYLLQNNSMTNSITKELQVDFLRFLRSGKPSVCNRCLSKAVKLMELHLNMEKLLMQILEVLRNFQKYLKSSFRSNEDKSEMRTDFSVSLSQFQQELNEKLLYSNFSDGMEVRLERFNENSSRLPTPKRQDNLDESNGYDKSPSMEEAETHDLDEETRDEDYIPEMDVDPSSDGNSNSSSGHEAGSDEDYDPNLDAKINHELNEDHSTNIQAKSGRRKPKSVSKTKVEKARAPRKYLRKSGPYSCPSCPSVFNGSNAYDKFVRHRKTHEEGWTPETKCPICQKTMMKTSLNNHIKTIHEQRKHEEEGTFVCEVESCQIRFKTKFRLDAHIERVHTEGKGESYCCKSCPKEFKSYQGLRYHVKFTHENPDMVVCPHCPKIFRKLFLTQHIRNQHGDKSNMTVSLLQCQYCPKIFSVASFLKYHEEAHRAEKKYKCNECSFVCSTVNSLNSHKKIHGEKMFQCRFQDCLKRFATKIYLRCHERSHTKEKLFKCHYCEKAFSLCSGRTNHMTNVHGYVPKRKSLAGIGLQMEGENGSAS